eukprot:COSAG02_NODE_2876_length_7843_cov_12.285382_2_plen_33_part_00
MSDSQTPSFGRAAASPALAIAFASSMSCWYVY